MNYRQDVPATPAEHLDAAGAALAEAQVYGPAEPAYLALVLTSVAHSMYIVAHAEVESSRPGIELAGG